MKRYMILLLLLGATAAYCQAKKSTGDPWKGTYKLDTSKSKFAGPPPKDEMVTVESATKSSVKYTIKGTDAKGSAYAVSFDGKVGAASPQVVNGNAVAQVTYQMPSSHEFTSEIKSQDGTSSTGKVTLSKDGKTITVDEQVKDASGAAHEQTLVYVKQ
jgi:hypothetical protein